VRAILLLVCLAVGGTFVVTGALRPEWLWNLGKVQTGRRWFGEGGVAALFIVFGSAFALMGAVFALRKNPPG
jgi:hypothetical protein